MPAHPRRPSATDAAATRELRLAISPFRTMSDSKGDTDGKRDDAGAGSSDAEDADWTLLSKCSAALGDEFDEMFTAFAE